MLNYNVVSVSLHYFQFVLLETVATAVYDARPSWAKHKPLVLLFCVVAFFIPGAFVCTQGGIKIFDLMDKYCAGFNVIILCLLEIFSVLFLYGEFIGSCAVKEFWSVYRNGIVYTLGYRRFSKDIKLMLGEEPSWWWGLCWYVAGPFILLVSHNQ